MKIYIHKHVGVQTCYIMSTTESFISHTTGFPRCHILWLAKKEVRQKWLRLEIWLAPKNGEIVCMVFAKKML